MFGARVYHKFKEKIRMEEELKEVEAVEEPKEQEAQQQQPQQQQGNEMTEQSKSALTSFILAAVGFLLGFAWLFSIAGIVLGAISLNKLKGNDPETEQQPYKTFGRVAKPVAIVDIVLGAVMFVLYLVLFILNIVRAIAEAAA